MSDIEQKFREVVEAMIPRRKELNNEIDQIRAEFKIKRQELVGVYAAKIEEVKVKGVQLAEETGLNFFCYDSVERDRSGYEEVTPFAEYTPISSEQWSSVSKEVRRELNEIQSMPWQIPGAWYHSALC